MITMECYGMRQRLEKTDLFLNTTGLIFRRPRIHARSIASLQSSVQQDNQICNGHLRAETTAPRLQARQIPTR